MAYLEERQGCKIISHIPFLREGGNLESMITSLRVIEGVDRDSLGEGERTGQVTLDLLPVRLGVQVGGHGQVVALTHLVKEFTFFLSELGLWIRMEIAGILRNRPMRKT